MDERITIEHAAHGDVDVITLAQDFDVYTAIRVREKLWDLRAADRHWYIVDLQAVEFIDSTGLSCLVGGLKRARDKHGSLDLVLTEERLLKIFRMCGLIKVFAIYDTVAAALAAHENRDADGE